MKFKFILSTILTATLAASSHAAITFSSNNSGGGGRQVTSSTGTLIPTGGGSLRIGYFLDSSSPVLSSGDWSAINALFIPLGEGRPNLGGVATPVAGNTPIPIPSGATAGRFLGQITGVTGTNVAVDPPSSVNSLSQGTRLFLFLSNSATPSTLAPTQFALVSDNTLWRAPKDDPTIPGGASLTMAMNATNINEAGDIFWGAISTAGASNFLAVAPVVPEPSSSLLGLLAAFGLIARRRR